MWQPDGVITAAFHSYSFCFSLNWATGYKSSSYLQNCSPELITLPPDWAVLLDMSGCVVSQCVCSVNTTERVLAWPHQYEPDRGLAMCLIAAAALQGWEKHTVRRTGSIFIVMINVYTGYTENLFPSLFLAYWCQNNRKRPQRATFFRLWDFFIFVSHIRTRFVFSLLICICYSSWHYRASSLAEPNATEDTIVRHFKMSILIL